MQLICISGYGDIGQRVAQQYLEKAALAHQNINVYGLSRSRPVDNTLHGLTVHFIAVDFDEPAILNALPTKDAVVIHLAPPPGSGLSDPRFRNLLQACEQSGLPKKIVLLSTTAVYGDCHGKWIDESEPVNPQTDRGKRRLDAEHALCEWATEYGVDYVILRVSGIYGPGRFPVERLQQGLPILREDQAPFSNRIHQDDLAMVCVAAAERAPNGAIYNVCDGHPSTMSHYFKSVATALGLPVPPEIDRHQAQHQLSAGMLSYLSESRRMANHKMLSELQISLKYPDLQAGLAEIVNSKTS